MTGTRPLDARKPPPGETASMSTAAGNDAAICGDTTISVALCPDRIGHRSVALEKHHLSEGALCNTTTADARQRDERCLRANQGFRSSRTDREEPMAPPDGRAKVFT